MVTDTSTAESRKARRHLRKERGQSMVEFALTAPVLIMLLLGLVEMGHAFNSYMTVVAAARDSARLGSQFGSGEQAKSALRNLVQTETIRLENAPIQIATENCGTNNPGVCITTAGALPDKSMTVRVCYDHSMIFGVPGVGKGPINMCSKTTIRIAHPGG